MELFGGFSELACSQHAVSTSSGPESARVSLAREREPLDRDFVLRWRLAGAEVKSQLLVHGEFAMLSLLPPAREGFLGPARDVVFVVDRSGSMQGVKMASAARACVLLLRTLGPRDRFAVQAFNEVVEWMPDGFLPADEGGVERGERWLRAIASRGGTELDLAMGEALDRIRGRGESAGRVPVVVLLTDGQVGDESGVLKRLQRELGEARVFTVGIDTAVNGGFLRRLAALGGGTSTLVEPGSRLEEALQAVGREIGTPLVTDLTIEGGVVEPAPSRLPDLFAGRASAAFFRFSGGHVRVTGRMADGSRFELSYELLRVYSPSAEVRGHGPGQEVLQVGKRDVDISSLEPSGRYAVQPTFSDGHSTGIYSWDYLYWLGQNRETLWREYLERLEQAGASREPGPAPFAERPKSK